MQQLHSFPSNIQVSFFKKKGFFIDSFIIKKRKQDIQLNYSPWRHQNVCFSQVQSNIKEFVYIRKPKCSYICMVLLLFPRTQCKVFSSIKQTRKKCKIYMPFTIFIYFCKPPANLSLKFFLKILPDGALGMASTKNTRFIFL